MLKKHSLADNFSDAFPDDGSETTDSDGDGVGDNSDAFPHDPNEWKDTDKDGESRLPGEDKFWRFNRIHNYGWSADDKYKG